MAIFRVFAELGKLLYEKEQRVESIPTTSHNLLNKKDFKRKKKCC